VQKLILKFFQNKTNFGKEKKKVDNDDDEEEEEKKMKIIGYVCVCFMVCFFSLSPNLMQITCNSLYLFIFF
jgi:uncharacterized protein YgfB (UPF0149 family)